MCFVHVLNKHKKAWLVTEETLKYKILDHSLLLQADFTMKQGSVVPDGSSDARFVAVSFLMLSWLLYLKHCTTWLGVNSFAFSFWTLFSLRSYVSTSLAPSSCSSLLYYSSFSIRMARFELPQCLLPACREQLFSGMAPPASPTPAESAHHVFMEMLHFCLGL